MNPNAKRRPVQFRRAFTLPQILTMRPYVAQLLLDLKNLRRRQRELDLVLRIEPGNTDADYPARRRRHQAMLDMKLLRRDRDLLIAEIERLGIRVGDARRGEALFPCLVDQRDAYFVWHAGEPRPTHFIFRGDESPQPIPERWFSSPAAVRPRTSDR